MPAAFGVVNFRTGFVRDPSSPSNYSALVLNADYRPLSYFPLSLWTWREAIKAVYLDRVDVIYEYDRLIRSPSISLRAPSVVALRNYVRPLEATAFTRFNLFLRDEFSCQYCGSRGDLTFDHVVPRTLGGKTEWNNVVAACSTCNLRKGAKTVTEAKMALMRKPRRPTGEELRNVGRRFPPNHLHETWLDFLYWDTELES